MKSKGNHFLNLNFKRLQNITLFDLISGLIFLLIILALFVFLLRKKTYINITIRTQSEATTSPYYDPPSWFSFLFHEGMKEKDSLGRTKAEIKKVMLYELGTDTKVAYLNIRLETIYNSREDKHTYRGKPVLIGSKIEIQFEDLVVSGIVTGIEGVSDPRKETEIITDCKIQYYQEVFPETSGVNPYVAEAVNVGDQIKDSQGKIVAEILEKKVEPAQKIVSDDKGNLFVKYDPLKKDVYLKLRLVVKEINNEYYFFDLIRVQVDQAIPLHFKDISIWPTVTRIYDSSKKE